MTLTIGIYTLQPTRTGAPFRIVFLQLRPDAHSFALRATRAKWTWGYRVKYLHTYGDAGGGLVLESSWHITTWTMTIIMTGFLLKGEKARAMHVYDKMIERGLKPDAV
jgi:pentatricopeptide repeat protein